MCCCRLVLVFELYKSGSTSVWSQLASICFGLMELTKTSVSGSAYASSSQSGVKRIKGSQVILYLEVEGRQGMVVGRQVLVGAGVVAGVGEGAEVAADFRPCLHYSVVFVSALGL